MPSGAETLAQLISDRAGEGKGQTYAQLAERSVDPETGYRPSANHLHRIATGVSVKMNPQLIRAIAAGASVPLERVQAAAAREYLGWETYEPVPSAEEDDEVIRAARRKGSTSPDAGGVERFVEDSRRRDRGE